MPYFFQQLPSTAPSFAVSVSSTGPGPVVFESTVIKWNGPVSRAVRFSEVSGGDYYVSFGSSAKIQAASTCSILVLGGTVEIFSLTAAMTAVSFAAATTGVSVNVTPGVVSD